MEETRRIFLVVTDINPFKNGRYAFRLAFFPPFFAVSWILELVGHKVGLNVVTRDPESSQLDDE